MRAPPSRHGVQRRSLLWAAGRGAAWMAAGTAAGMAAGCGTTPPTRFYELRLEPPEAAGTARSAPQAVPDAAVWEVSPTVALPSALDRDVLVVATGSAGLEPLAGHRWAAPLRDSVPRVLLHDLQVLRGPGRVWAAPVPAGVQPTQRLRVELLALQGTADRRLLRLQAQWWWQALNAVNTANTVNAVSAANTANTVNAVNAVSAANAAKAEQRGGVAVSPPAAAPRTASMLLELPLADASVDTLAAAHRLALWRLAQEIARSAGA